MEPARPEEVEELRELVGRLRERVAELERSQVRREQDREQDREELRESRRRYRGLFEDSPTSLWEEDFSAVQERFEALRSAGVVDLRRHFLERPEEVLYCASKIRVLDVNRATLDLYGAARKEDVLSGLGQVIVAESIPAMAELLGALAEGRRSFEIEAVNGTLDGRRLEIQLRCFVAPGHEETLGRVLLAITDITERKRVERELLEARDLLERRVGERTADLAAAHEDLKSLLYIVSHDLRAPLINVKGFAGELQAGCREIHGLLPSELPIPEPESRRRLAELLGKEMPEALSFIDTSINRINHFMNTLLRLSQQGQRALTMEQVDTSALVKELLATLAFQLEQRQTKVHVAALPPVVADRISLEQIFGNLLSNAVLYLEPERPGVIEVSGSADADAVTFHVRDNGCGIPKEDLPKVFAPFRRGRRLEVEGEGMGLAYVQALVRRHGGRIWCRSEPGVGSTFSFSISARLQPDDLRSTMEIWVS